MKKIVLGGMALAASMIAASSASAATAVTACGSNPANTCGISFNGSTGAYGNTTVINQPFTDSYTFDLGTGSLSLDLTTTFANAVQNIKFSLVRVSGNGVTTNVPFVMDTNETYRITNLAVTAGTYMLTLNGARETGNANSPINASYTGNIAFAAAVPEPATWAMMFVGFGMVAGAARYRRRATSAIFA